MQGLQLGPLALPWSVIVSLAAVLLGSWVGRAWARRRSVNVEPQLLRALLVAVLVARLAFVWSYRAAYLEAPWSLFNLRDGGWSPQAGVMAAWLYTLVQVRRQPLLRRPLLAAVGTATAAWVAGSLALLLTQPPMQLPSLVLDDLDRGPVALSDFAGQPVVLNLWATWCPPCRREMPVLQQAQQQYPGVHFVFLNQAESDDKVRRYLAGAKLQLRNVLMDRRGLGGAPYGSMLPTTLFFDAQGRLVHVHTGELSMATLAQRLPAR